MIYTLITNVIVSDIFASDAPDFVDAYISSADYDGKPMTEEQLDNINEDRVFVYECLTKQLY